MAKEEEHALPLNYSCSVVQLSWEKFGGNLNLPLGENNTWTQQLNITDNEGCCSSKHFLQTSLTAPLLRLLEGQDHTFQLSEGMGTSFSRRYSAWKSQFANFFVLPCPEKLQGEEEQTCLRTKKGNSEWFSVGHISLILCFGWAGHLLFSVAACGAKDIFTIWKRVSEILQSQVFVYYCKALI